MQNNFNYSSTKNSRSNNIYNQKSKISGNNGFQKNTSSYEQQYQVCYANNNIDQTYNGSSETTSTFFRALRPDEDPANGLRYPDECDPNIDLISHVAHGSTNQKKACAISTTSSLEVAASWSGFTAAQNNKNRGTFVEFSVPSDQQCVYNFKDPVTPNYHFFQMYGFDENGIDCILGCVVENAYLSPSEKEKKRKLLEDELLAIKRARASKEAVFRQEVSPKNITGVFSSERDYTNKCDSLPQKKTSNFSPFCITDKYNDRYIIRLKAAKK